jgi:hypothetical protein
MDNRIFILLLAAAVVHILEEYVFPGGFAAAFSRLLPRVNYLFTPVFHWIVNGVFLLVCFAAAAIGKTNLVLSLSAFGLIFANAVLHIRGAIINRAYYPGVLSAAFIYIPLSLFAYYRFISSGQITWPQAAVSFFLGVSYMGALMVYVLTRPARNSAGAPTAKPRNAVR